MDTNGIFGLFHQKICDVAPADAAYVDAIKKFRLNSVFLCQRFVV